MDNQQMMDTARELGYMIQQDERYIRAQMAQIAADEDETLQNLIGEFNLKRIALNTESVRDDRDPEKLKKLYDYRLPIYRQCCDVEVTTQPTPQQTAELILKEIGL